MIRALTKRSRPDTLANEKRRAANPVGRTIYLGILTIFVVAVMNYLFGDLIFLRADGLVLKDQTVVATTYVVRVQQVDVKEGQQVEAGQVLMRLQSTEMLERLADLSARRARLVADNVEFRVRSETVSELLPLAKKREEEATRVVGKFDQLNQAGFTTASSYDTALTANYNAQQDRVKLGTQLKMLERELMTLQEARDDAESALANLQAHYAEGIITSPVSGSIGATVPSIGNVYRIGDPMLSIYFGEPYVLAYLPRRYLFSINVGQNVTLSDGRHVTSGEIIEILPVTDALAKEFQNTFKPRDRSQLAKIKLLDTSPFPLLEKVEITSRWF
ncbi:MULTISPECIES: biotin/lipoyl-binding protein [Rhodomicrobium]|uniref:HlyD family secretion protein n=1 Tax=Rhodomicrobium TaxID=1068 RepID=UPI000B4BFC31|nr:MULTISPECIES: biotin/lipoyl-binding protein [Rhodomicrobium]